jgi:hypothetical protein
LDMVRVPDAIINQKVKVTIETNHLVFVPYDVRRYDIAHGNFTVEPN